MKTATRNRLVYKLTPGEERIVRDYLNGSSTSREVGKSLGISHQQAINMSLSLVKQWIEEGKLLWSQPIKLICPSPNL